MAETHKALESYSRALALYRKIGYQLGEAAALGNSGVAYAELGDITTAIKTQEQSLAIAHAIDYQFGKANALWNSAEQYWKLGQTSKAIARGQEALQILAAIEDPHLSEVRMTMARWKQLSAIANEGRTVTVNEIVKKVGFVKNHSETRALVMKVAQRTVETQTGDRLQNSILPRIAKVKRHDVGKGNTATPLDSAHTGF